MLDNQKVGPGFVFVRPMPLVLTPEKNGTVGKPDAPVRQLTPGNFDDTVIWPFPATQPHLQPR
jgi:hypothetical protein